MRSGKKAGKNARKKISKKTAILAHPPYRFAEQEALKEFAQSFTELGISHGCLSLQKPAEQGAVSVVV